MKKLLIAFFILGLAAPAAWGLYSAQQPAREIGTRPVPEAAPPPLLAPLSAPLDRFNDWGIALKRSIKAYINREQRAATEGWAKQCLPRIGEGMYASARRMGGDAVTTVAGKIYNVSGRDHAPAVYKLKLFDSSGKLIRSHQIPLGEIKAHSTRSFHAVVRLPGAGVARVGVVLDAALAHH